ncbi:uncharacterized protein [Aristolochia californica]|uniref:uncharacterized protein n=1 Tax=Aristolochia californica TaxID=171875 RepID=UPI0035DF49CD
MDVRNVYNQSAISYFESKKLEAKDDHWVGSLSSDVKCSPKRQNDGRRSTKKWVLKAFYSDSGAPKNISTSATPDIKPSAPSTSAAPVAPSTHHQTQPPANKVTQETKPQLSIRFQESLVSSHAEKFKFCLVGKFTHTRPKLPLIRNWIRNNWALKGKWSLTLLDPSHILVRLENDDDMLLIWTRQKWTIEGHLMKVFKWSPKFPFSKRETSMAAVWVSFPFLPLVFFQQELLISIASLVGTVVAVDGQTKNLSRTDVARIWIEVDLSKELPKKMWIGIGNSGFWQAITYKNLPSYCTHCRFQGHSTNRCKFNNIVSRDNRNRLHFGMELENKDNSHRKWAQYRSLFQDAEEDTLVGPLLPCGMSITKEDELKNSQMNKIVPDKAFCQRGAEIFNEEAVEEEGFSATEEPKKTHLDIQEQGPFDTACNLKQNETGKTISEERNCPKVVVNKEGEKGRQEQVEKEGDYSEMRKKVKSSREEEDKKPRKVGFHPTMKKKNDKSLEERAPSRSISPEQPIFSWQRKEKKERHSSELKEVIPNGNRPPMHIQDVEASNAYELYKPKRYNHSDVKKMTKSFSKQIGRGGFGTVFHGELSDGRLVGVKVLHSKGAGKEFDREVKILGRSHHVNIVKLLGFCSQNSKRALIYEFIANGSLDKFIDSPNSLESKQLHQIAVGIARGLEYLHEGSSTSALHLDIKPANILLDKDFCPKISDFGLAKEWKRGKNQSFKSTRGTHGYIAPEHLKGSEPSNKSDVYSYGVMLLEMAVGRRELSHERPDLFEWAKENANYLHGKGVLKDDARKMIVVGLCCVQDDPENRPSMSRVVKMLEGKFEDLKMPTRSSITPHGVMDTKDSLELYLRENVFWTRENVFWTRWTNPRLSSSDLLFALDCGNG